MKTCKTSSGRRENWVAVVLVLSVWVRHQKPTYEIGKLAFIKIKNICFVKTLLKK